MAAKTEQTEKTERILFRSPRRGMKVGVKGRQPFKKPVGGDEWEWVFPEGHTIKFIPYQKSQTEMSASEAIQDPWGSEYVASDPVEIAALRDAARRCGADNVYEVGPVADPLEAIAR